MRGADAPYVPEFQRGLEPVAAMGVPGLHNGYFSGMSDRAGAPGVEAGQAGALVERRTHVENILASLSHRRSTAWAGAQREAGREVPPEDQSQAAALRPAAAAAAAAAGAPRPAPPAGPLPPSPVPDSAGGPAPALESPALLPRSPGAAAAARALAALAPAQGAFPRIPAAPAVPPAPTGTGAQNEPLFLSAAASSAARALSSLAGAPARAASARPTPPPSTSSQKDVPVSSDGPDFDHSDAGSAQVIVEVANGSDAAMVDDDVAQPDPQLDDILPAKSKSFFRLRRER